ncbi:hypothetical protein DPMN_011304 [Dreissena polymorpha]|uniref:Uncharacterized protein n=2 Tax=Dreissena polymorpha TaxID=45954 RepID=A0A9D4N3P3_DREPO|nr:hypothetical protein DPMN_011304 [Dreissena polymorpha]
MEGDNIAEIHTDENTESDPCIMTKASNDLDNILCVEEFCIKERLEFRGDVSMFESMFQCWQQHNTSSEKTEHKFVKSLEIAEKQNVALEKRISDLENTIELLQESLRSTHNDLHLIDVMSHENADLKGNLRNMAEKHFSIENEMESNIKKLHYQIKEIKNDHSSELLKLKHELEGKIAQKTKEIDVLKCEHLSELNKITKDYQKDIAVTKMEYESKLVKLQCQKAATAVSLQQQSSHQDIYRQKLQHFKKEHEEEINRLQSQIKSLQTELSACKNNENIGIQVESSTERRMNTSFVAHGKKRQF